MAGRTPRRPPGWLACAMLPLNWWLDRRFRRKYEARWGRPYNPKDFA
ncbi:hypothetical protein OOK29_09765 [Streptomyces phaeochromogenes]|nr:hypothetical protein [Streptomyces phaeochromogenes]MCX5598424.1 hypothetical protein [Streptomyces phaeochromogenes]